MSSRHAEPKTFLDVYNLTIAPKLREIDVFLKEREMPVTFWQTSQLLDMQYDEVKRIVHNLKIENINHDNLCKIIMAGTSRICRLIQRETERGFPFYYKPDDISVIYEINVKKIEVVFEKLGISEAKESWLPFVFEMLPAEIGSDYYSGA